MASATLDKSLAGIAHQCTHVSSAVPHSFRNGAHPGTPVHQPHFLRDPRPKVQAWGPNHLPLSLGRATGSSHASPPRCAFRPHAAGGHRSPPADEGRRAPRRPWLTAPTGGMDSPACVVLVLLGCPAAQRRVVAALPPSLPQGHCVVARLPGVRYELLWLPPGTRPELRPGSGAAPGYQFRVTVGIRLD